MINTLLSYIDTYKQYDHISLSTSNSFPKPNNVPNTMNLQVAVNPNTETVSIVTSHSIQNPNLCQFVMFHTGLGSDISVKINDKTYALHKKVLKENSRYFEALLSFQDQQQQQTETEVVTIDSPCNEKLVQILLQKIYDLDVTIPYLNAKEYEEFMTLADFLLVRNVFRLKATRATQLLSHVHRLPQLEIYYDTQKQGYCVKGLLTRDVASLDIDQQVYQITQRMHQSDGTQARKKRYLGFWQFGEFYWTKIVDDGRYLWTMDTENLEKIKELFKACIYKHTLLDINLDTMKLIFERKRRGTKVRFSHIELDGKTYTGDLGKALLQHVAKQYNNIQ